MGDLDNEILNAALEYAKHGWRVLPLVPGEKGPLTDNGFYDASTDEAQIRAWWRTWPKANIGLSVGPDSNLCVIDEDNKNDKDGRGDVTGLERELGPLPVTFTVHTASENAQTGARGTQYYYQFPDALRDALIKKQLAYGVDVKAKGGYVVAAPSVINGRAYAAEGDINNMAELPQAWIDAVKKAEPGRQDLERLRPKGDGSTICEQYGISMGDVLTMPAGARKTGDGYLMSHPEHGATGKGNLFVNPSLNVWCCYRHGTGGDPLTWVAVREGFIDCRDAGRLDSDTVKRCVEVLRRDGLIPELKPVPVDVEDAADALLKNEGLLLAAYRQTIDEYHYGEWALKTLLFRASHRIAFHSNASLVHVDMTGPSRGGKTTLVERHLAFIPHGHKIVFVTTSPKAAWYQTLEWKEKEIAKRDKHGNEITEIIHYQQSNPEYYAGKLIVFFEISDMPGFETFKVLAEESEKSTHTYTTVIQGKAVALQLKGPRGVITTSVSGIQEDAAKQILNRMLQGPIEDKTPENERQKVEMLTRHVLDCTEIESDQRAAVVQRAIERLYHDGLNVVMEPTQGEARKLAEAVTRAMAAHGFNMTNINQFLALCQCGAFEKRFARGDPGCCRVDVDDVREAWFIINTFSAFTQANITRSELKILNAMAEAVYPKYDEGTHGDGWPTSSDIHKATGVSRGAINKALKIRDEPYGKLVEYGYVQYDYDEDRHANVFSLTPDGKNAIKQAPEIVEVDGQSYEPKDPYAWPVAQQHSDSLNSLKFTFDVNFENGTQALKVEKKEDKDSSKTQFTKFTNIERKGGLAAKATTTKAGTPPFSGSSEFEKVISTSNGQKDKQDQQKAATKFTSKSELSEFSEFETKRSTVNETAGPENVDMEKLRGLIRDTILFLNEQYYDLEKPLNAARLRKTIITQVQKLDGSVPDTVISAELDKVAPDFIAILDRLTGGAFSLTLPGGT